MGGQVGGFHNSLSEYLITIDGVINENLFQIKEREMNLDNNLEISHCKVKNPITGEAELFLGLLLKSKWNTWNQRANRYLHHIRHFRFNVMPHWS